MRIVPAALVLPALFAFAAPAAGQARADDMARKLNDPVVQEGIAGAVSALAGIVLDTRVGPLAAYTDGRVRPGDTLRDVKRRDDPYFEERLNADARRAVRAAGAVASDGTAMAAELGRTAARLQAALAPFVDYAGRRVYDDHVDRPDDY